MKKSAIKKEISLVFFISLLAIGFLIWLIYIKPQTNHGLTWIKHVAIVNAGLNFLSAFFLVKGYRHIKRGEQKQHIKSMFTAFLFSSLFLVGYILYHHFHGETKFLAQGIIRPIYFFILITHIALSIPTLPMVLTTFTLALRGRYELHKKWAKWTFPLWLYVSVTGVLVTVLLKIFNI